MHVLDREDRWFERGVKEAIYVKLEQPSLKRGGGLRHQVSAINNAVLKSLPKKLDHSSHVGTCDTSYSHDELRSDNPADQWMDLGNSNRGQGFVPFVHYPRYE